MEPWTIYLWRNNDNIEGAAYVPTIKQIYRYGWAIETVPDAKRNEDKHREWRAKVQTKNRLNNTLNVLRWYGKQVLDIGGNIDPERLAQHEAALAYKLAHNNEKIRRYNLSHKDKIQPLDMNDILPIKKFPHKTISVEKANQYGFL